MNAAIQPEIDIFYGRVSQNSARVYAQVKSLAGGNEWTLSGNVRGPHSQFGHTLPASFEFRDLGSGPSLLAEALVAEPCFWSPRLPALYDVQIELRCRGVVQRTAERSLGIRFLGTRGRDLMLDTQRWVLRGVHAAAPASVPAWRDVSAAMVVDDPDEEQCNRASRHGVLLVARLTGAAGVSQRLSRLGKWAATAIVVLPQTPANVQRVVPNLLLADSQSHPPNGHSWCFATWPILNDFMS